MKKLVSILLLSVLLMGAVTYPGGVGITIRDNTELEASDMTFMGTQTSVANPYQTDYSDIKAGIVGNPGALGGVTPATEITVAGDGHILSDTGKQYFGAGDDMSMFYDGTDGNIKTDEIAASDLNIITGAAKTLVYDTAVYEDLNFDPAATGGPAATIPNFVTIGNVVYREFTSSNNEIVASGQELPHKYKLSSQIYPHIHVFLKSGESAGTTGVSFTFYWALRESDQTLTTGSVVFTATSAELTTDSVLHVIADGTGFAGADTIGAQLAVSLARTAGDAGDVIATTYGVHYAIDTPGSRLVATK